jgi:hypothetical protein
MTILFSSHDSDDRYGGIYELDEETLEHSRKVKHDARGLAIIGDTVYAISGAGNNTAGQGLHAYDMATWKQIGHKHIERDWHGLWAHDGLLWAVAANADEIAVFDPQSLEMLREWKVGPGADNRCHINDLCIYGGKIYLTAFRPHQTKEHYTNTRLGAVRYIDVPTDLQDRLPMFAEWPEIVGGLQMPHTPWHNGSLYYCDSKPGFVVRHGDIPRVWVTPGFTRGLAVDGETLWVGCSRSDHGPHQCGVCRIRGDKQVFIPLGGDAHHVYSVIKV